MYVVFVLVYSTYHRMISEQEARFRTTSPNPVPKHLSRHRMFRERIGSPPPPLSWHPTKSTFNSQRLFCFPRLESGLRFHGKAKRALQDFSSKWLSVQRSETRLHSGSCNPTEQTRPSPRRLQQNKGRASFAKECMSYN